MFWIETALFAFPIAAFSFGAGQNRMTSAVPGGGELLEARLLYRIDTFLGGVQRPRLALLPAGYRDADHGGRDRHEILAYVVIVKIFPILPGRETATGARVKET